MVEMGMDTAHAVIFRTRIVGCKQRGKADVGSVCYRFQPLVARRGQVQSVKFGPVKNVKLEPTEFGTDMPFVGTRKPFMHSSRRQSSAIICAATLNARCGAKQTQIVLTRQAPTMTHIPAKDKLPDLDDGGTGSPPRDDGGVGGGGRGGGGGGNWSGGFFLFGFLLFLGFLKDKENEERLTETK